MTTVDSKGTAAPVFDKGRDLDATGVALSRWLADRLDVPRVEVGDFSYPQGAGVSNETILFTARWPAPEGETARELVLRVRPRPDYQVFLDPEFHLQYTLLKTLHGGEAVRVPRVLWYEEDHTVLGQPFFLMERMHGRVPVSMPVYNAEGFLVHATPAQRRTLWVGAMEEFARIHRVPVDAVRFLDRPELGATGLEQQLAYWSRYARWALGDAIPDAVAALLEALADTAPPAVEPGLSWGDARIGNMMFGDDFRLVGVMDWEQASLAGPITDLGWWLFFDHMHSDAAGLARLDGLGDRDETIALWQELTGLSADGVRWHEAFAAGKATLLAMRTGSLRNLGAMRQGGRSPYLEKAYRLLDLPVPEGVS
jgi:aminoglycoside phosphotransferase (APT) family kinase protein